MDLKPGVTEQVHGERRAACAFPAGRPRRGSKLRLDAKPAPARFNARRHGGLEPCPLSTHCGHSPHGYRRLHEAMLIPDTVLLVLSPIIGGATLASAHPTSNGVIYSSLCTEAESGDVAGYQIVIAKSASPPSVTFQWSEGGLMEPVMASAVAYDVRSGALRFTANANGRASSFSGRISGARLAGTVTWVNNPGEAPQRERVQLSRGKRARPHAQMQMTAFPHSGLSSERPLSGLNAEVGGWRTAA